jgi:hypothetical protein
MAVFRLLTALLTYFTGMRSRKHWRPAAKHRSVERRLMRFFAGMATTPRTWPQDSHFCSRPPAISTRQ